MILLFNSVSSVNQSDESSFSTDVFRYSSTNQAIFVAFVLTSGAGMSRRGPIAFLSFNSRLYSLIMDASFRSSRLLGFAIIPPFEPPYGIPAIAHFHVIQIASALTSANDTSGCSLNPPLAGPRAELWCTRYAIILPSDSRNVSVRSGVSSFCFKNRGSLRISETTANCPSATSSGLGRATACSRIFAYSLRPTPGTENN